MFAKNTICKILHAYWIKMKHYDLALDISIVKADVSIMTDQTEDIIICDNIMCVNVSSRVLLTFITPLQLWNQFFNLS